MAEDCKRSMLKLEDHRAGFKGAPQRHSEGKRQHDDHEDAYFAFFAHSTLAHGSLPLIRWRCAYCKAAAGDVKHA